MSRLLVWLCLSMAGLLYWGFVYSFAPTKSDHFAGPVWFGGISLLVHWLLNRHEAAALKE